MSALSKLKFRPALPGEFTRRAFFNNKLDLTEIEGLADLIHAETEQQRKQALLQADGNLSKLYTEWRCALLQCTANIEAYIDFSEEDNIEHDILEDCNKALDDLKTQIEAHLSDGRKGEILRNGVRTVIIGEPNVGKSSLLNHLVQRNAAIVTSIAGTTRDIVELNVDISGYPVVLADTAGLAKFTDDVVEKEGIRRAKVHAEMADFVVLMADASVFQKSGKTVDEFIRDYVDGLELTDLLIENDRLTENCIVVFNKIDLLNEENKRRLQDCNVTCISCIKEEGFRKLVEVMTKSFEDM